MPDGMKRCPRCRTAQNTCEMPNCAYCRGNKPCGNCEDELAREAPPRTEWDVPLVYGGATTTTFTNIAVQ